MADCIKSDEIAQGQSFPSSGLSTSHTSALIFTCSHKCPVRDKVPLGPLSSLTSETSPIQNKPNNEMQICEGLEVEGCGECNISISRINRQPQSNLRPEAFCTTTGLSTGELALPAGEGSLLVVSWLGNGCSCSNLIEREGGSGSDVTEGVFFFFFTSTPVVPNWCVNSRVCTHDKCFAASVFAQLSSS